MGNSLKLVKTVEYIPVTSISEMIRVNNKVTSCTCSEEWNQLCVRQHAQLSLTDELEDKATIYSAELTFYTPQEIDRSQRYAWKLTMVDGTVRIIGSNNRPYAIVSVTESAPTSATDNQWNEVKVTYSAVQSIPYLVV